VGDSALSVLNISVSTTDGRVTLSGTASSAEDIRKAMALAADTDGVREVASTLQVK
jgi:osmotically-inducible protein OsmY